jgi:alpha-tubulin suppressor-like RCC1 family protein
VSPYKTKDPSHLIEGIFGKHIIDIDCGDHHSLALDGNGKVYSWGGGGTKFNKG